MLAGIEPAPPATAGRLPLSHNTGGYEDTPVCRRQSASVDSPTTTLEALGMVAALAIEARSHEI